MGDKKKKKKHKRRIVKYGPKDCVSTYRNKRGECIVKTDCADVDEKKFKEYELGLLCVDKEGVPTRHVFGKGSFDPEEKFDTLISCHKCMGLDEIPEKKRKKKAEKEEESEDSEKEESEDSKKEESEDSEKEESKDEKDEESKDEKKDKSED